MPKRPRQPGTALITGGAKRLGREMALHLAARGRGIALHYHRSEEEARKTAGDIEKAGGRCRLFPSDLADPERAGALIGEVRQACPDLDVLVNSASVFAPSPLGEADAAAVERFFSVHLRTPLLLIKNFAAAVSEGQAVNFLDSAVTRNTSGHAVYLLSKKALLDLTKLAAVEFGPGLRVNAIAPGLILPPEGKDKGYLERRAASIPLRRRGGPEDILAALDYLLDNAFVTGQVLFVDGGEHLL